MSKKEQAFLWLYRIFTLFVPGGVVLWSFLIEKLISNEITVMNKIGIGGIFVGAVAVIIGIYFYKKHLKKKIQDLTNQCIECVDIEQKRQLVAEKKKYEVKQEIFSNACFIAPFVLVWLVLCFVEKGIVSLRGTMFIVCASMAVGFGFNCILGLLKAKGENDEDKTTNTRASE